MKGQCLCSAVTIETADKSEIGACHCGFCRKWGGGPMLAVHCGADVEIDGTESVRTFASSDWAERAFCRRCGTHLYYKLHATGEHFIPAGLIDSDAFEMASQIYIDKKPAYYDFANETPMLTEQQVIEQFAPPDSAPD